MGQIVIGWRLDAACRQRLLALYPARYEQVVADHVTLRAHVEAGAAPPPPVRCRIVGRADDGLGVEAMVVEIDGESARPDGSVLHITWSLADNRRAFESNAVIAELGWTDLAPVEVDVRPVRFVP